MDAFEEFESASFVGRLLGKGDVKGLQKKLSEAMPEAKQQELMDQMAKGMTLRMFRTLMEQMGSMGPLSSVRARPPRRPRCKLQPPSHGRRPEAKGTGGRGRRGNGGKRMRCSCVPACQALYTFLDARRVVDYAPSSGTAA